MTENGKLSLARVLENGNGDQLQLELPQLRMSAELQGINASFPNVLLDESCYQMRDSVEGILAGPTEIVGVELPPASVKLNLLPESWRRRRSQLIRRAGWRKRLVWIGGAYVALLFLLFAYLGLLRFQIGRLDAARCTRRSRDAVRPRDGSELEGTVSSDRCALLPGRNSAASFRKSAISRGANYDVQPVGAADCRRWRGEHNCSGLSVHREDKEESGSASLSI